MTIMKMSGRASLSYNSTIVLMLSKMSIKKVVVSANDIMNSTMIIAW